MIPVVSFYDLVVRRGDAVANLRRAGREWGLFYLEDTGIPREVPEQVMTMSNRFFALPEERKRELSLDDRDDFRGYVGLGEELTNGKPDMKESLEFAQDGERPAGASPQSFDRLYGANPWPEESSVPGFQSVLRGYMERIEDIADRMMDALVDSLEVDPAHRDPQWSAPLHYRTRLIHYQKIEGLAAGSLRVNEHTDLALFNLLRINARGLEAKHASGEWAEVPPRPDSWVVILGELCEWWTRGEYSAGVHRVRQVTADAERTSMPFFFYPNLQTTLRSIDGRLAPETESRRCGEILFRRLEGVHPHPEPVA